MPTQKPGYEPTNQELRDRRSAQADQDYPRYGADMRFQRDTQPLPDTHDALMKIYFDLPSHTERMSRHARNPEQNDGVCRNHAIHLRYDSHDLLNVYHHPNHCGGEEHRPGEAFNEYAQPTYDWRGDTLVGLIDPPAGYYNDPQDAMLKIVALACKLESYLRELDCAVACHIRKPLTGLIEGRLWELMTESERRQYAACLLDLREFDDHDGSPVNPATHIRRLALEQLERMEQMEDGATPSKPEPTEEDR